MRENKYQAHVIRRLRQTFPRALILKNDAQYLQGVPDLLILDYGVWAALEVKRALESEIQPNQRHYVDLMNEMSFASFISPENEEEVFDALEITFAAARAACIS